MAKTGSTSFTQYLHNNVPDLKPVIPTTWKADVSHIPLWAMKQTLGNRVFKDYFKFTFVRNPWARCVSSYEYILKWNKENNVALPESFVSFLNNIGVGKYGQQSDFGYGCDYFAKLENLSDDLDFLCEKLKLPRYKLPHRNKTNHKHYTEYYDEETKAIVDEMYAKDIEQFEYKFGE
jgi:hypothetical protein